METNTKLSILKNYNKQVKIGIMLLAAGFLLIIFGTLCGGLKVYDKNITKTIDLADIKNIGVYQSFGNINVIESSENYIEIQQYDENLIDIRQTDRDINLNVNNMHNQHFFTVSVGNYYIDFNGFHRIPKSNLTIYVTRDKLENLSLHSDLGDVTIKNIGNLNYLNLDLSLGEIFVNDVTAERVDIDSNLGDIKLNNFIVGTGEISSDLGSVDFNGDVLQRCDFDLSLGDMDMKLLRPVTGDTPYSFDVEVSLGDIEVANYRSSNNYQTFGGTSKIEIESSLGSVDIN